MAGNIRPVPEGFSTVTPHLVISGAGNAIAFYKKAFGAVEQFRLPSPDGKLMHAQIKIGNAVVMLCDDFGQMEGCPDGVRSPEVVKGTTVALHLYVDDVDAWFKRAVEAGAKVTMPPMDMFWGDRYAKVMDPYGHDWSIATHKRDLSPEDMKREGDKAMAEMAAMAKSQK